MAGHPTLSKLTSIKAESEQQEKKRRLFLSKVAQNDWEEMLEDGWLNEQYSINNPENLSSPKWMYKMIEKACAPLSKKDDKVSEKEIEELFYEEVKNTRYEKSAFNSEIGTGFYYGIKKGLSLSKSGDNNRGGKEIKQIIELLDEFNLNAGNGDMSNVINNIKNLVLALRR
jgi:hypothetical protein